MEETYRLANERLAQVKALGIGIMQLTYNTQNFAGAGYLEEKDSGLTGFGKEMASEMNRVGVLCDLSHVGEITAAETIDHSVLPCAITHCLPKALKDVPRNKSDALFKRCAAKGGVIGVSLFAPGLAAGNDATVSDVVDAISHMIDLVGEDLLHGLDVAKPLNDARRIDLVGRLAHGPGRCRGCVHQAAHAKLAAVVHE